MRPVHELTNREIAAEAARLAESIERAGVPRQKAIAEANRRLGISGVATPEQLELDEDRLEKEIELNADKQLRALGFEIVKFSQPGKTKQTPGIADRRYYHRARRLAFWWEAKSATGRQRPDQRLFQELVEASGDLYVLGTDQDLFNWLVARRIAARGPGGTLEPLPLPAMLQVNEILERMPWSEGGQR